MKTSHRFGALFALLLVVCAVPASAIAGFPIRVVDEAGEPVAGAMVMPYSMSGTSLWIPERWESLAELAELPDELNVYPSVTVLASAPGYAWGEATIEPRTHEGAVTVTLTEGREVTIELTTADGREVPETVRPIVIDPAHAIPLWFVSMNIHEDRSRPYTSAVRSGETSFTVRVPGGVDALNVIVNEPGFLRGFTALGVDVSSGHADIELPAPGVLRVDISPAEALPARYERVTVRVMRREDFEMPAVTYIAKRTVEGLSGVVEFDDLVPQEYTVRTRVGTNGDEDYFDSNRFAKVEPGATAELSFQVSTYDEAFWRAKHRGEDTVLIALRLADGSSAFGASYRLVDEMRMYGRTLELHAGEADGRGVIRLTGVNGARAAKLHVNGEDVGYLFPKEAERGEDGSYRYTFTVEGTPTGSLAPDIPFVDVKSGEASSLRALRGKVVVLDVWASWCGPCQSVMAHSDELVASRADWEGKVEIVGLSVDKSREAIESHLKTHGWWNVTQVWMKRDDAGKQPDAYAKLFIKTIPHLVVIDQEGKIAWQGKPGEVDVEGVVDGLLEE